MKTKDWFVVLFTLVLTIAADQITKYYASDMKESWLGPVHFILIHNEGAMLGLFANLPAFLRIVTISTSGFFVFSLYAFLQYIIPMKLLQLRIGLSLLVGGIIGNVIDRTYFGYVIDFIGFQVGKFHSPIWNIADMIQWVGYLTIVHTLIKNHNKIWPDKNSRSQFWVNKKFQLKYAFIFIGSGVLISLISLVFSYTYFKISMTELGVYQTQLGEKYTQAFLYSYLILTLTFSVALFIFAKFISHQIAGPIYAFERYFTQLLDQKDLGYIHKQLKLRAGDDFKHLEKLADKIFLKIQAANELENELKNKSTAEDPDIIKD